MARKAERVLSGSLRWGVSGECDNEEQMGVLLGAMTVLGCTNMAWAPIRPERVRGEAAADKNPNMVAGAKKAAATRKRKKGDRRKPAEAVGAEFLAAHHGDFTASQINSAFERAGYASTRAYSLLNRWIKAGSVKRTGTGTYQNLSRKAA
jgi:hypothetical protein